MKKILFVILLSASLLPSLFSCGREQTAEEMMRDFISAYGAEGVVYHSGCAEGDEGYLAPEKLAIIYQFSARFPTDYAIFLNSRAEYGSECAFFVTRDAEQRAATEEMCRERLRLLGGGLLKRSRNVVFYSTMSDGDRAEQIFNQIIK